MKIIITPRAQKALARLPKDVRLRAASAIDNLEKNPFPPGSVKLTGQPGFRIRVGRFRILYLVDKKAKKIIIARIAHRREAYRK